MNINEFERRGWITYGIDCNKDMPAGGNIYRGDFENYDFDLKLTPQLKEKFGDIDILPRKFDLLWMNHVLEHFRDPIKALKKAYNLLSETGVLYLATPDIDFIFKTGVSGWGHWSASEHYILWSEQALVRELEKIGFNVILKRRNFSSRYVSWYDLQIICQRRYF
jgi:predicted SAM-dependent methyltransferase